MLLFIFYNNIFFKKEKKEKKQDLYRINFWNFAPGGIRIDDPRVFYLPTELPNVSLPTTLSTSSVFRIIFVKIYSVS